MGKLGEFYKRDNRKVEIETEGGKFVFHIPSGGESEEYQKMLSENGGEKISATRLLAIIMKLFCDEPNLRDEPLDEIHRDTQNMGIDDINRITAEFMKAVELWQADFFRR